MDYVLFAVVIYIIILVIIVFYQKNIIKSRDKIIIELLDNYAKHLEDDAKLISELKKGIDLIDNKLKSK